MLLETVASPPCLHLSARHRWLALPRPRSRLARDGAALAPSRSQDGAGRGGSQARVALPATCGELVQGTLDGIPCLVSCPIGRYSMAEVRLRPGPGWDAPPDAPKAAAALRGGLAYLGRSGSGGRLRLVTDLPRGRGYASSTADVGATLFALGQAMGQPLTSEEVAQLAVGVEPSDSTLFPGLTLFDHRGGGFHECLGPAPSLSVVILDPGGEVDTLAFNRVDHRGTLRRLAPEHRRAFALLREGLEQRDWEALGEATTLSACAHQAILPDPLLEPALALARKVGALGVCRAHSGTLLGLLLDPVHADVPAIVDFVAHRLPDGVSVACHPLVDGGPRYNVGLGVVRSQRWHQAEAGGGV
jgi:L-threonine kinase